MLLPPNLLSGKLVRRYQRFLADVLLDDGTVVTVHCPNSGSMRGCNIPASPVLLSRSGNPHRKLSYTWELVHVCGEWVSINTQHPNRVVREAIETGKITELWGYDRIRGEVPYGENSRIDLLLEGERGTCYVEVKSVSLVEQGVAFFPDAVTMRGQKHLRELMSVVRRGNRGIIFFAVQRGDAREVTPADAIDPEYGRLLREAVECGVEALAYGAAVTTTDIALERSLPVRL